MSIPFVVHQQLNLIFLKGSGRITSRRLAASAKRYSSDPSFHGRMDVCLAVDAEAYLDIEVGELSRTIAPISARIRPSSKRFRVGCALPNPAHEAPLSEGFRGLASSAEARIFKSVEEALGWIGHSNPEGLARLLDDLVLQP